MGIVTIRAGNLAFKHWVTRGSADLGALRLVTGEANFELGCLAQDFILGDMHRVTIGATDVAALVGASGPVRAFRIAFVASDACCTLGLGRCATLCTKGDVRFRPDLGSR